MKKADSFDFNKYVEYINFIEECKLKKYDENLVLHKHHIIPKHLCVDEELLNSGKNICLLSVDDHIKAHLYISEMYDDGTYENISNLRAVRILSNKSIKDKKILNKISKSYMGSNNPFYGKTHTKEVLKKISEKVSKHFSGKTYEEIYGKERADEERKKRSKKTRTDEEYKKCGKKISKILKGRHRRGANPFAQPYLVDGVYFDCRKSVLEHFGRAFVTIKKYHKVEKLDRKKNKK